MNPMPEPADSTGIKRLTRRFPQKLPKADHSVNRPLSQERPDVSWLGRWADVGWAIKITPGLSMEEWSPFNERAEEVWSHGEMTYSSRHALVLLSDLYSDRELVTVWPTCSKRVPLDVDLAGKVDEEMTTRGRVTVCSERAHYTETHQRDVYGNRVAIARCEAHKGQL